MAGIENAREQVLKKIRRALLHKTSPKEEVKDFETNVFQPSHEDPAFEFAEKFVALGGNFAFCESELDFKVTIKNLIQSRGWSKLACLDSQLIARLSDTMLFEIQSPPFEDAEAVITGCEALISFTGGIMVSSRQPYGRSSTILPPIHIVIASPEQLVPDLRTAYAMIKDQYGDALPSMICNISGPSRTADIEKTLVRGAHGPKELFLFLVDEE
jgi:L-lactate dehydrogenase complex protein LldG